jgi:hypothetical protein
MQSTLAGKSIEQDLSILVPDSVITLDDWELENDDVDGERLMQVAVGEAADLVCKAPWQVNP